MSEEFKPIRITLSEEAFERLETIMKTASFRNNSSAIEECIRVVYNMMNDLWLVLGEKDTPEKSFTIAETANAFNTIATRMSRFTDRIVIMSPEK